MKLIFIGDIVGENGQNAIVEFLPQIKQEFRPQLTIANAENISDGRGIHQKHYKWLLNQGIDVITLGNHAFDNRNIFEFIHNAKCLVRPINLPESTPGHGVHYVKINHLEIAVLNVLGTAFMNIGINAFVYLDTLIDQIRKRTPHIFIDFHAESTSEKQAFAHWLDGKVSAVVGTHTHVQTNDGHILNKGTAYLTDVGMTGSADSIIGFNKQTVIHRFLTQLPSRMEVEVKGPRLLSAVFLELDDQTGKALKIVPILKVNR
ncbi:TIGR00282 family metallophosphoesterase [Facklamia sp. DSM 111018]|uniref:TIGR00282 family metallophosphoesterase n=1 Tax=Facklamia lactis TaxID=2749967 RepID=A0ABS0LNE2_9LACT|nr:TIGR00282 family metallophosphoesterase [Facklamia lactis]MBG9979823.1 TIGR00282 family metallophosphoesterase [Facklamia lactis]MBG9985497.1 TIGR00282 family metallophosphoesterase [Facklamia lactis]